MTETPQNAQVKTLRQHISASIALGLPLIGTSVASMLMGVTDTVMLGRLGAEPLAASVLGNQVFFLLMIAGLGLAQGVMPLAAAAVGANDVTGVRRSVRMGFWVVIAYAILVTPIMFFVEPILLFMR
ncbi:MAG: MATE family efflux transporter, partial [Rhodobacteraceae bacterium]|nr:MATE family efflux transporter [Paracoccaceae bacterium]